MVAGTTGAGGGFSFSTSFSDISTGLFGEDVAGSSNVTGTTKEGGVQTERLFFNQDQLTNIVERALQGGSLANIFTEEDVAGIFNSSVSKQAAGDVIAQITGELAKLTGERRVGVDRTVETDQATTSQQKSEGILDSVFGGIF